jgi:hypothetical protein
MFKTTVLFILCLPLGWIAWIEAASLLTTANSTAPVAVEQPDLDDLTTLSAEARAVVEATKDVKSALLLLDGLPSDPTSSTSELYKVLADHVNARKALRDLVDEERAKAQRSLRSP